MAWFAWQSALLIVPAFILGCLVGYWYWRIQYRKAAFTESEAVTVISRRHERTITEKDAEIDRLQSLLVGGAGVAAASDDAHTAPGAAAVGEGDDAAPATDSTTDADDTSHRSTTTDGTTADSTTNVAARAVDTAAGDTPLGTAHDGALGGTPDPGGSTDAPDGGPVAVVDLPRETDVPAATVVDVTDSAVTDTDPEAVAQAVAQLPTQSTGGGAVIDLASLESSTDDPPPVADVAPEPAAGPTVTGAPASDDGAPAVAAGLLAAAGNDRDDTATTTDAASDDSSEDDLERIEGIGPRIASALRTAGIRSFRRLADADVPTLQAALEAAGLRFAPSLPTWSRQARFLADGDEVGFIKLTESLVAGREPGRSR